MFERRRLKDWLPGAFGIFAVVLMVVIAANMSARTVATSAEPAISKEKVASGSQAAAPATSPKAAQAEAAQARAAAKTAPLESVAKNGPAAATLAAASPEGAASAPSVSPAPAKAAHDTAHSNSVSNGSASNGSASHHGHVMAQTNAAPAAATASPLPPPPSAPAPAAESGAAPQKAAIAVVDGDAAAGRQVYKKCQACHSLEPGRNLLGPSLAGIVGHKAGADPHYNYSPAMKQSNLTWDVATLDAYLADPQKTIPGNKMPFPGLKTDRDRTNVIAFLAGETSSPAPKAAAQPVAAQPAAAASKPADASKPAPNVPAANVAYMSDAKYTLRSGIAEGKMVFLGVGGTIDGKANPVLTAVEGQVVQVTLINGEGTEHDIVFPDQDTKSPRVYGKGASVTIVFRASKSGDFLYYCDVPGHRLAGMEGQFLVTPRATAQPLVEADISREPTDLPPPLEKRDPKTVRLDLFTVEHEGRLAEATTFGYWTFNGKVPGPFVRVRVGDTVEVHLKNAADSNMIHSVDFHAATGPGGGAAALQVYPGDEKSMTFKALAPGLYVYHCATPMVAEHIANGMYGLILVEPEGGLPPVDHEFYVMQGEVYTEAAFGQHGSQEFSVEKLLNERPEYLVFNGSVGAISKLHPLRAKVGETVRIFFGVGGPNFTSSFHVIGEIFDRVYNLGSVTSTPLEHVQTVTVPPGGATITEFKLDVPGSYTIVDHALARAERGLAGLLVVEGAPNRDIYDGEVESGMGH